MIVVYMKIMKHDFIGLLRSTEIESVLSVRICESEAGYFVARHEVYNE